MRSVPAVSVLALGLLVTLSAAVSAAPARHSRVRPPPVTIRPDDPAPPAARQPRFAVPGWSDQSTQQWIDNGSRTYGIGG